MNEDFSKYAAMKLADSTAEQTWLQAADDGLDLITRIRLIRAVYSLSLAQAKEIHAKADYGQTLDEHQGEIAVTLEQVLREDPSFFSRETE